MTAPVLLTAFVLDHQLAPVEVMTRMVLVMSPRRDGRVLRGMGECKPGTLHLRAFYWLRIDRLGTLRIRITSVDRHGGSRSIYFFSVSYSSN